MGQQYFLRRVFGSSIFVFEGGSLIFLFEGGCFWSSIFLFGKGCVGHQYLCSREGRCVITISFREGGWVIKGCD